jgi:phosphinothricin acetyltransferase
VFRERAAYSRSVETSVYLDPSMLGHGLGTALYAALLDELAHEDVHRAYAGIALPNDASEALHRRLGFREVGTYTEVGRKFGRWWDVRWYERPLP